MVLVNGGYLHCTDIKEILVNFSVKATKKEKLAKVISKIQVSDPGPSWPSCLKILWEKDKLLEMRNFSFSHSVFYLFEELVTFSSNLEIVVCNLFQFGRVKKLSFGK